MSAPRIGARCSLLAISGPSIEEEAPAQGRGLRTNHLKSSGSGKLRRCASGPGYEVAPIGPGLEDLGLPATLHTRKLAGSTFYAPVVVVKAEHEQILLGVQSVAVTELFYLLAVGRQQDR